MKKRFLKSAIAVAAIAFSGFGLEKVTTSYQLESPLLLANVEALSQQNETAMGYAIVRETVTEKVTITESVTYPDGTTHTVTRTEERTRTVEKCVVSANGPLQFCNV